MSLLDFFFPKYCVRCKKIGSYLCANCFAKLSFVTSSLCLVCNKASLDGLTHPKCRGKYTIDGAFCAIAYKGVAKKLLYVFKYQPYVSDLEKVLGELFYEGIIQHEIAYPLLQKNAFLVPIPLHKDKFRKRGYNQAELLAEGLGKRLGLDVYDLLKRVKKTKSQYGLKREERLENMKGAFEIRQGEKKKSNVILATPIYRGRPESEKDAGQAPLQRDPDMIGVSMTTKTIFLVDDVLTSGSTLFEAAKVLKKSGVEKVYGLTLARD